MLNRKPALSVGKCDCEIGMCTHRANCRNNPLNIAQAEMDNASTKFDTSDANLGLTKKGYAIPNDSVYTKEIWNAAIEAAAQIENFEFDLAERIRKLKK